LHVAEAREEGVGRERGREREWQARQVGREAGSVVFMAGGDERDKWSYAG
jgi:hypothetical protein